MLKKTPVNDKISNNTYSKVVLLKKNNTCMITFMTCNNNMQNLKICLTLK